MEVKKLTPDFYVYYNQKTGRIVCLAPAPDPTQEHQGFTIPYEEAELFLKHKLKLEDHVVGYKKLEDGSSKLGIILNTDHGYAFKNNVFEWIRETDKEIDCQVTWNKPKKLWEFSVDKRVIENNNLVLAPKLVFFVTLESDFDFLIRTISISIDAILNSIVQIPFESTIEENINKISISSRLVFESYGLKVIHE